MIWFRRLLTIPLGIILLVLLALALALLQLSETLLSPDYYPKTLRQADFYEFVLVDLTTSALEEARALEHKALPQELEENPLVTLGLSTKDVVASLNRAVPPEWLQSLVEKTFEEIGTYIVGGHDRFSITPGAGTRVRITVSEIKTLLRKADGYNLLYEELVTPVIEDVLEERLPLGMDLSSERLLEAARKVAPPQWLEAQVEAALDEITPYIVGDRDTFEIRVEPSDRVEIALEEVKDLLREANAYDLAYGEVIEPGLEDLIPESIPLPLGISMTSKEIVSVLRQVAPPSWVQEQAERVIDEAGPYLAGRAETLVVTIQLDDNKREARSLIIALTRDKLQQGANRLPRCTAGETLAQVMTSVQPDLPRCVPVDVQTAALIDRLGDFVAESVESIVLAQVPDSVRFTDALLLQVLTEAGAEDNVALLDDVRKLARDGWTYSDRDLRKDIRSGFGGLGPGGDAVEALDDVRAFLSDQWTYTERDLRKDIVKAGGDEALTDFDLARDMLRWARGLRLLAYLPALIVMAAVGFLAGRSWSGRFQWSSAFLVVASAIVLIVFWPVYNALAEPRFDEARDTAIEKIDPSGPFRQTSLLATNKVFDVVETEAGDFASGVAAKSVILLIVGLVGLGISFKWGQTRGILHRLRL